ncbi:hypothetical protein [Clostridium sp. HBUAS56017]|uniref:hypothetical protein n=1 Tax=Clostridium sp. HBUAS56017 TaxID=2571128 RepID=UPI001178A305|nr:hypothetical protein [Clostridium sp. HBUAS56017]
MEYNTIVIDYKDEEVAFNSRLQDSKINMVFDGSQTKLTTRVPYVIIPNVVDNLLFSIGEKTTEEWENENLKLQARIEDLENQLEIKDEVIESLRS